MKCTLASLLIGLSLIAGTATGAWAQDFDKGLRAYDRRDYATALREWRSLAESRHAAAQYNLGVMYAEGKGVVQDYREAVKWWRLAARQGHVAAQFNLANSYKDGQGVVQDYREAVKWYRLAAEQGDADAQSNLGVRYGNGEGVIQDNIIAHMWMNIGAANGNKNAANNRDIIAEHMTTADISKAQQLARECVAKNYKGC